MRFKIKKRQPVDKTDWHPWFAWFPVKIGSERYAWLEIVQRRGTWIEKGYDPNGPDGCWKFEYIPAGGFKL